jgi:hypothetical protein
MHAYFHLLNGRSNWKALILLLFLVTSLTPAVSRAASEPVGKVESMAGTAFIQREGRAGPANVGDPVHMLDKIETQADGTLEILFLDNSRVKMASGTVLEITEYLFNPAQKTRQGMLSMISGKARFLVQDLQDFKEKRFRVRTQTSVVGTRDTDFIVRVKAEGEQDDECREALSEAFCVENAIQMFTHNAPDQPVVLTVNMISRVCGVGLPSAPRFATSAERRRLLKGVEEIGDKRDMAKDSGSDAFPTPTQVSVGIEPPSGGLAITDLPGGITPQPLPLGTGGITPGGLSIPPPGTRPGQGKGSLLPPPPPPPGK